jgi:hypothetical protein
MAAVLVLLGARALSGYCVGVLPSELAVCVRVACSMIYKSSGATGLLAGPWLKNKNNSLAESMDLACVCCCWSCGLALLRLHGCLGDCHACLFLHCCAGPV